MTKPLTDEEFERVPIFLLGLIEDIAGRGASLSQIETIKNTVNKLIATVESLREQQEEVATENNQLNYKVELLKEKMLNSEIKNSTLKEENSKLKGINHE